MSQTDVTGVAEAVSGITIDGPAVEPGSVTAAPPVTETIAPPPATTNPTETTVEISGPGFSTGPIPVDALPGKNVELFDKSAYLDAPMIDGQAADKIKISFSGSIEYDATDAIGRQLFETLVLGKDIDLRVSGPVVKKQGTWKLAGKEGEEQEVVTGQVGVKVTDLFVLRPEDL